MHAIAQRVRPKHQVLVLKCYPRTTKGAVDVKPNSSELSYLLYYANSRKTKNQKVGSFLEKKTASDVWRLRIGNVQVTLQILEALIEKSPKDLPLYAPSVLKILDLILRSNDITMIESSIPTFEAFCANHDAPALFADQHYLNQYEEVVRQYARMASTRGPEGKAQHTKPVLMRYRHAGLEAIKCVAASDSLSSAPGRRLEVIVPMILENLWTDNEDFLDVLLHRAQADDKVNAEQLLKRRTSIATVRTMDTSTETNAIVLSGSAADGDKLAEEDIGVLAMQCLKHLFVVPSRAQIWAATKALLAFIDERLEQDEVVVRTTQGKDNGWAIKMTGMVAKWAPVQDRYVILTTTMDSLVKTQMKDDTLSKHVAYVAMMGSLLRSDINLIGLSVMDILLGLMQQLRRLVQMPGDPSSALIAHGTERSAPATNGLPTTRENRIQLLDRLQSCMGDLATHVYYADQVADMVSAVLARLRPKRSSSTSTSSPHGEVADNAPPIVEESSDALFGLAVAKTSALNAVKLILVVANSQNKVNGSLSRNRVPIQAWEGTHWLLRDGDSNVRKAYVSALVTWLEKETTNKDQIARDDIVRSATNPNRHSSSGQTIGQRILAGTSIKEKIARTPKAVFLQQLHVAIYDNALQYLDHEPDLVLLHVLLTKLVYRLGINAVVWSVPMIFRLQEDIQDVETPAQKVRLGALCHGYFWALMEKFDFDVTPVGRTVTGEISRRRTKHFWVEGINVPPPSLDSTSLPKSASVPSMPTHEVESEALLPFDERIPLVELVCNSYEDTGVSPPASPATSPNRSFTQPMLASSISAPPESIHKRELPLVFREQLLFEWSREAAVIAISAATKSASLAGSRAGTVATGRGRVAVANGSVINGHAAGELISPGGFGGSQRLRPQSQPNTGLRGSITPRGVSGLRKSSVRSGLSQAPGSHSSRNNDDAFVTTVEQMKMVLSGQIKPRDITTSIGQDDGSDESMVSYEMTGSEFSYNPSAGASVVQGLPKTAPAAAAGIPSVGTVPEESVMRPRSRSGPQSLSRKTSSASDNGGPLSSHPTTKDVRGSHVAGDEDVPPVPPIPLALAGDASSQAPPGTAQSTTNKSMPPPPLSIPKQRNVASRSGDRVTSAVTVGSSLVAGSLHGQSPLDLSSLLDSIDPKAGEQTTAGKISEPPY